MIDNMMTWLKKKLRELLNPTTFTSNRDAAAIIHNLIFGEATENEWEWDDFYSIQNTNPDVEIALALCWYFEELYPSSKPHEYCAKEGADCFLKIANALEQNKFSKLDKEKTIQSIKNEIIPDEIKVILDTFDNDSGNKKGDTVQP